MTRKLPLVLLLCQCALFAQTPIFSPSSNISSYGVINSPAGENFPKIIDGNINTKFLDFSYIDGIGFTVDLGGVSKVASSMEMTTANDFPQRDPQNYQIFGSNNGTSFTQITAGTITCDATRFNTTNYNFSNTTAYTYYRLIFTNQCNTSESVFQIAEVQLFQNTLKIDEFDFDRLFSLSPNPNNGNFSINASSEKTIDAIIVRDILGKQIKVVSAKSASNLELNLEGIAKGIYFVQISSGNENVVKKVIIK